MVGTSYLLEVYAEAEGNGRLRNQRGVAWPRAAVGLPYVGCRAPHFGLRIAHETVTDTNTDLIWLENAACTEIPGTLNGEANFDDANAAAALLQDGLCGLTDGSAPGDWRLPSVGCDVEPGKGCPSITGEFSEILAQFCGNLFPILNKEGTGCTSGNGDPFSNLGLRFYWSSTERATGAWQFGLTGFGPDAQESNKDDPSHVWPVRD